MSIDPKDIKIDQIKIPKKPYKSIPKQGKIEVKPTMITPLMEGDNFIGHENFTFNKTQQSESNKLTKQD